MRGEEVLGLRVPRPAQVGREVAERRPAASGRTVRTVNRRIALTRATLGRPSVPGRTHPPVTWRSSVYIPSRHAVTSIGWTRCRLADARRRRPPRSSPRDAARGRASAAAPAAPSPSAPRSRPHPPLPSVGRYPDRGPRPGRRARHAARSRPSSARRSPCRRHRLPRGPRRRRPPRVVLRRPRRRRSSRRRCAPSAPRTAGRRRRHRHRPRATGRFTVEAWGDPVETWRHRAEIKVPAGHRRRARAARRARCCSSRALDGHAARQGARAAEGRASPRCADTHAPGAGAPRRRARPRRHRRCSTRTRCASTSPRRSPVPVRVERERALRRHLVRVLPALARAPRSTRPRSRHVRDRRRAAARRRGDGLRRASTCRRSTRSAARTARAATTRSTAGPGRPRRRRGRSARAEGGHDAVHPDLGTLEDFRAFVAARRRARASRSRSTSRCSARPTTRGSPSTRSGSRTAPTARSPTPRTRRRSTRTSTRSTSTTTPTGIRAEVLRVVRHWIGQGVRIFRVDNPHTKPVRVLGVADRRRSTRPTPTSSSSPRRSPARR